MALLLFFLAIAALLAGLILTVILLTKEWVGKRTPTWRWRASGLVLGVMAAFPIGFVLGNAFASAVDDIIRPLIGFLFCLVACSVAGYFSGLYLDLKRVP